MKNIRLSLLIVSCLSLSLTQVKAQTNNSFFCSKVMSYNILNTIYEGASNPWNIRKQFVFDVLNETSPDIIGFQEDSVEQVEDLEAEFPLYNIIKAPISIQSRERAYHSIFYNPLKFSLISNGSFSEVNRARRNVNWAKLIELKTGTMLFVINGHFLVPAEPQVRLDAAIQYATQIALLNTENAPIIMFGDLNSNLSSPPVQYLTSEAETFPNLEYPPRFKQLFSPTQWRRNISFGDPDLPIMDSIDYILTSEELKFSNAEKVARLGFIDDEFYFGSDHDAVLEKICFGSAAHLLTPLYFQLLLDDQSVNIEMESSMGSK